MRDRTEMESVGSNVEGRSRSNHRLEWLRKQFAGMVKGIQAEKVGDERRRGDLLANTESMPKAQLTQSIQKLS